MLIDCRIFCAHFVAYSGQFKLTFTGKAGVLYRGSWTAIKLPAYQVLAKLCEAAGYAA